MNKEALEGLISVLDNWAAFFTLLVVIGVGGELVVHVISSRTNKKLIALQSSESLTQEAEIARLKKDSASFELDIARANKGAADANERAAGLEVQALHLRKELLSQGPRANLIAGDTRKELADALKPFAKQPVDVRRSASVTMVNSRIVQVTPIGDDTAGLASALIGVLKEVGWSVPSEPMPSSLQGQGVIIEVGAKAQHQTMAAAQALAEALRRIPLMVNGPSESTEALRKRVGEDPIQPPLVDDTIVVDVLPLWLIKMSCEPKMNDL